MTDKEVIESLNNAWRALSRQYKKYPDEGIRCGMNLLAKIIGEVNAEVEEVHKERQITIEERACNMYDLYKAKYKENGVWVEGNLVRQKEEKAAEQLFLIPAVAPDRICKREEVFVIRTWYPVECDTICSFVGKVDQREEKIWEYDLIMDRFGRVLLVCWNPIQCVYYGILLKRKDGRKVQGCFRIGAFRLLDLERIGSILDKKSVKGRWITYFC